MRHTRLLTCLGALAVAIGLASLILFRPSGQQFSPSPDDNVAETYQPNSAYRPIPTNKENDNATSVNATVDSTKEGSGPDQKQKPLSTTTRITDEGEKETTTVTYENGITTTTTVTEYPDGSVGTHEEWVADEGVKTPEDLSIEEEIELAEQWLAHHDNDPNVTGVTKTHYGKFLPLYENTIYITRSEKVTEKGNVVYTGKSYNGMYDGFDPATEPVPAGMRVIELDKEGNTLADYISNGDPWQYISSRGLDPIVYFYGEETADFMAEYFNASDAVASQSILTSGNSQDTAFDSNKAVTAVPKASSLAASETINARRKPSPQLLDRIQEHGFDKLEDIEKRLQDADPEMAWRKHYIPDVPTPKGPDEIMRRNGDMMDIHNHNEDHLK